MPRKPVIAVVGAGREIEIPIRHARELGRMIAENGWTLVTGGRDAGVMRAVNEGAKEIADSLTIGILPDRNTEVAPNVDVAIFTDTGEARNNIIVLSADVVIACVVDDAGTASEVALALKNDRPVIIVAANDEVRRFYELIGSGRVGIAETPADAIQMCRALMSDNLV